ncbi:MAG: hypothetical protein ACK53I_09195, partial [Phenylobacterium sp.]
MSVASYRDDRPRRGAAGAALAWLWPDPLETEARRAGWPWVAQLGAWLWPDRLNDEPFGRRHGLMAMMFGWAWPEGLDQNTAKWWRESWMWSWIWPGRVMGPDGEICPLMPWHAAMRPEVCPTDPWHRKVTRHGGVLAMMFAAGALAAPTVTQVTDPLDGGRLSVLRGGGETAPQTDGSQTTGDTGAQEDGGQGGDTGGA